MATRARRRTVRMLMQNIYIVQVHVCIKKIVAFGLIGLNAAFYSDKFVSLVQIYGVNPSVIFRLLKIFEVENVASLNLIFGQGLFEIYTQPPLINFFVQCGVFGMLLFFANRNIRANWYNVLIILNCNLLIAPQFYVMTNILLFLMVIYPKRQCLGYLNQGMVISRQDKFSRVL